LAVVASAGAAVRIGYVLLFRRGVSLGYGDAYAYHAGADLLASGRGFVEPMSVLGGHPWQGANHPPLYPLWLTVASLVVPGDTTGPTVHMLWSCCLGVGTVVLCGLIARRLGGERTGIVAAALAAVYPNLWFHDGMLLSETMAVFTIALTLWASYCFWEQPTTGRVAWLGACCGLAALSRSELMLTVPVLLVPFVLMARTLAPRRRVELMVLGVLASLATISPWVAYNNSRFDAPVYLSTNAGGASAAANCESTYYGDLIGYKDYLCSERTYTTVAARTPGWDRLDVAQQDQLVRGEVSHYIRDHAERLPTVMAARVARLLKLYGVRQEMHYDTSLHSQEPWVVRAGLISWYTLAPLAVAGALIIRRRNDVPLYPLVAVPALVVASVAVTFAQTRYRAPAEVAVVLLAAVTLEAAGARRRPSSPSAPDPRKPDNAVTGERGEAIPRTTSAPTTSLCG
jgi:4-amino-4-deoxy-L-arabinose transferase-like glycosyltransferase